MVGPLASDTGIPSAAGSSDRARIIVFASGTPTSGGSGFEELVKHSTDGTLHGSIVAVVSNHANGGVKERALRLSVPFVYMAPPYDAAAYTKIVDDNKGEWVVLSGWLKLVSVKTAANDVMGLDPAKTINIHPGPLPKYGGKGMYGMNVHRAVEQDYRNGVTLRCGPTMHFVTAQYDDGPIIFHCSSPIEPHDTPETIQAKVIKMEHTHQWWVIDLAIRGHISWDGYSRKSLNVPSDYQYLP
eukprot:Selendium_serpulae@DN6391_c2_g1_i1.p2